MDFDDNLDIVNVVKDLVDKVVIDDSQAQAQQPNQVTDPFQFEEQSENQHQPLKLFQRKRSRPLATASQSQIVIPIPLTKRLKSEKQVAYVVSSDLLMEANRLPKVAGRALLVHKLIEAYGLLDHLTLIQSKPATLEQLRTFHTADYLNYLEKLDRSDPDLGDEDFGIGYDCVQFPNILKLAREIGGGSITAAQTLLDGHVRTVINWTGGWHHALSDEASGYCYVNDINLAILRLLNGGLERILYVDYDLHHGDGVELAFGHSRKVMTVSFHKFEVGFFPGTGSAEDIGRKGSSGENYSINCPLKDGLRDGRFLRLCRSVLDRVVKAYKPEVIVAQFGADGLAGDPMVGFNLTERSFCACLDQLMNFNLPLLILGGGGYHSENTARLWTQLTARALGRTLTKDIPDHELFLHYGPSYELTIEPLLRKDQNTEEEIDDLIRTVEVNLERIKPKAAKELPSKK